MWFLQNALGNPDNAGAGATDYMHLFGLVALGYMWCLIAEAAKAKTGAGGDGATDRMAQRLATGRFFMLYPTPGNQIADGASSGKVRKRRPTVSIGRVVTCAAFAAMCAISSKAQMASRSEPGMASIDTNSPQVQDEAHKLAQQSPMPPSRGQRIVEDHSGRKQVGKASIFAPHFQGQRMANGRKFDHRSRSAASKAGAKP